MCLRAQVYERVSLVLQLLSILQVDCVELDGLGVVLHESERVPEAVARLSHVRHVVYLPRHGHRSPALHKRSLSSKLL